MSFSVVLDAGFIELTEKKALTHIKAERNTYKPVWDTIEAYCIKNHLIISNRYVLTHDVENKENICRKLYAIYTDRPLKHANALTNLIHKNMSTDSNNKYTRLKTLQENQEFIIEYNLRQVAMLFYFQKHKAHSLVDLISPVNIKNLLYLPSDIELIDVYHMLYDPGQVDTWDDLKQVEQVLFKQLHDRREQGILGGQTCKQRKKEMLEALKIDIVSKWLPHRTDVVLLGSWARDWLKSPLELCANLEKIQLIADIPVDEFKEQLKKFIKERSKFDVSYREQQLHIPKDFRTKRYTFYIHIITERGVVEKPFLDLFNCAEFELVPYYKNHNMFIASKWVQLRFLCIDLWVIRIIKNLNLISGAILHKKINMLWSLIEYFRGAENKDIEFMGIYRNSLIDKKLNGLEGKMFYPYYPEIYKREYHKYRIIN